MKGSAINKLLAALLVIALIVAALALGAARRAGGRVAALDAVTANQYRGKTLSILGDSLSTFGGNYAENDRGNKYADGVYTYPGNKVRYPQENLGVTEVGQTYWHKVIEALGMKLLVNDSWAGSYCSWDGVTDNTDAGDTQGPTRYAASPARIARLGEQGSPDVILVNIGTNDLLNGVPVGEIDDSNPVQLSASEIDDDALLPVDTFAAAYRTMLIRLMFHYPEAKIICMTPSYSKALGDSALKTTDDYCECIRQVCDLFGIPVIDTRLAGVSVFESTPDAADFPGEVLKPDGIHYNPAGMELLADLVIRAMLFQM